MNLRTGIIAVVLAAAGGATAVRAFSPQPARAPALDLGPTRPLPDGAGSPSPRRERRLVASPAERHGPIVYVAGEVVRPGVYHVAPDARAVDALHLAGGPTKAADLVAVNLAAPVEDGAEIIVPAQASREANDSTESAARSGATRQRSTRHRRTRATKRHRHKLAASSGVPDPSAESARLAMETVDVNAADESELETLPGIGPALAGRIVAFRQINGAFASSDELLDVAGMTQSKIDALAPYLTFR